MKQTPVSRSERDFIFRNACSLAGDLQKLGARLAALVDRDPLTIDKLIQENPTADKGTLHRLERVGRGQLHCDLFAAHSAIASRLSRLPIEAQSAALSGFIPVAVKVGESIRVVQKRPAEITDPAEARRAVDTITRKLTPISEQKALLAAQSKPAKPVRYRILPDGLWVYVNPLSLADVTAIQAQMQKNSTATLEADMKANQTKGKK